MYGRRHQSEVSLFPFLDLLACLIGALIVIIAVMLLSNVSSPPGRAELRQRQSLALAQAESEEAEKSLAELEKEIERLSAALMAGRDQMRAQAEAQRQSLVQRELAQAIAASMFNSQERFSRLLELRRERDGVLQQIQLLRDSIVEEGGLVQQDRIRVHFAGGGRGLKPTFVECRRTMLVVHGQEQQEISVGGIANSNAFQDLLDIVKGTEGGTMIFLVRPEGVSAFNVALAAAERKGVRNGKLPIPGAGILDLGPFEPRKD